MNGAAKFVNNNTNEHISNAKGTNNDKNNENEGIILRIVHDWMLIILSDIHSGIHDVGPIIHCDHFIQSQKGVGDTIEITVHTFPFQRDGAVGVTEEGSLTVNPIQFISVLKHIHI